MIVVLTGATGFLGARIRRDVLAAGHRVRAVVRDPSRLTGRGHPRLETYRGDLASPSALAKALPGADVLVHAVGASGPAGRCATLEASEETYLRHALAAASAAGVKRVLVVNSALVFGPTDDIGAATERTRAFRADYVAAEQFRKAALRSIARSARGQGLSVEIVYPAPLVGPDGPPPQGFVRALTDACRTGDLRFLPRNLARRFSVAHVDDVAAAMVAILERGETDGEYLLAGEPATFATLLHGATAGKTSSRSADWLVRAAAACDSFWRAFAGGPARPMQELVGLLMHEWVFDASRVEALLGRKFRAFVDAFAATAGGAGDTGIAGGGAGDGVPTAGALASASGASELGTPKASAP